MFTYESDTLRSSFNFGISIIVVPVLLAMHLNSSFVESKLFVFICRKYTFFLLSGSYIVELRSGDLWIGQGFRLTSLDNIKKEIIKIGIIFTFSISKCQKNKIFV